MTRYLLRMIWNAPEDFLEKSARSNFIVVNCDNAQININVELDTYNIKENGVVTFKGTVLDEYDKTIKGNPPIKIHIQDPTGNTTTSTITPSSNGSFTYNKTFITKGDYIISFSADSYTTTDGIKYEAFTTNEFTVHCGIIDTKLTLNTDVETGSNNGRCIVDQNVKFTAKLLTNDGVPIKDRKVIFNRITGTEVVNGETIEVFEKIGESKTTVDGTASILKTINTVGEYKIKASFSGDSTYNSSTTSKYVVITTEHTPILTLNEKVIYNGYKLTGRILDENDQIASGFNLNVTVTDPSNNKILINNKAYSTNTSGFFETDKIYPNSSTNYLNVKIVSNTNSKFKELNFVKDDLLYSNSSTINIWAFNQSNDDTRAPYRNWNNLNNIHQVGSWATCGRDCTDGGAIASASGTANTPAPIRLNGFNFTLSEEAIINNLKIDMRIRHRACDKAGSQIKIAKPTIYINSKTENGVVSTFSNGEYYIPYNSFTTCTATFNNMGLTSKILNDPNFYVYIKFGKNLSSNIGLVDISEIKVSLDYIPPQNPTSDKGGS